MKKLLSAIAIILSLVCMLASCDIQMGVPGGSEVPTVEISEDGYWVINGVKTAHKAIGEDGKDGVAGEKGDKGDRGDKGEKGDVGELAVKGPGVMTCYYKNETATQEVLKNGWLYTGDMAMEDEDGFIFLVDRKKDVIISGGENIYPVQIENFIRNI